MANPGAARKTEGAIEAKPGQYRVLIVDDSAVIRGLIARWLRDEPSVHVAATASNGIAALDELEKNEVDVVILDIEMPQMDGMTALPKMLRQEPDLKIVMSSTLTRDGAEVTVRALALGAADYIPKPSTASGLHSTEGFRRDLIEKVKALGAARQIKSRRKSSAAAAQEPAKSPFEGKAVTLRPPLAGFKPELIAVGCSTGGPQALGEFCQAIKNSLSLPVMVTQHMPPTFTTLLAAHIERATGVPIAEAEEGEPLRAGRIYLAPGDYHMNVGVKDGAKVVRLNQDPPENFCRPAVDVMLRSAVKAYGGHILAVILTGMGYDGKKGGKEVVEAGGVVVAQDEATSVVWGMPGAVATAGLCSAVLPLRQLAQTVARVASGEAL